MGGTSTEFICHDVYFIAMIGIVQAGCSGAFTCGPSIERLRYSVSPQPVRVLCAYARVCADEFSHRHACIHLDRRSTADQHLYVFAVA